MFAYSIVAALLFAPPAIVDIDEVLNVYTAGAGERVANSSGFTSTQYLALRDHQTTFRSLTAWLPARPFIRTTSETRRAVAEFVDGSFFGTLGIATSLGRPISSADDSPSAPTVVVLAHRFWANTLGADLDILGRTLRVGSAEAIIVGVVPSEFRGVYAPNVMPTELWLPLSSLGSVRGLSPGENVLDGLQVKARLKSEVSLIDAVSQVRSIGQRLSDAVTDESGESLESFWDAVPAASIWIHESVHPLARRAGTGIVVMIVLVLLVACTNLASLLVVQGLRRRHEMAVCLAIGASRRRLISAELAHSTLLVFLAFCAGLPIAQLMGAGLSSQGWQIAPSIVVPLRGDLTVEVFLLGLMSAVAALVVCGVYPALRMTSIEVNAVLASENPGGLTPRWHGRAAIIAGQVALSVVLGILSLAFLDHMEAVANHDPGFDIDRLALLQVDFSSQPSLTSESAIETLDTVIRRLDSSPRIEAAAFGSALPVGFESRSMEIAAADGNATSVRIARMISVSPNYFHAAGIALLHGRPLDQTDGASGERVVVLSRQTALALFGSSDVIGRSIQFQERPRLSDRTAAARRLATVVGIVEDTDVLRFGRRSLVFYVPFTQEFSENAVVIARSQVPTTVAQAMVEVVSGLDSKLWIVDQGSGRELIEPVAAPLKAASVLGSNLAGICLLLSMVGLYGSLSYNIACRISELGIRIALGATAQQIVGMIMASGLRPVVLGVVVGLTASVPTIRVSQGLVNTTIGFPVMGTAVIVGVVLLCALLTAWWPARWAASMDAAYVIRRGLERR